MNNTCPTCGAIYNVAAKDIGRRIKCKKCSTSLEVRESGLEIEDPNAPPLKPVESPEPDRGPRRKSNLGSFDPLELVRKVGGLPTALFGCGVFIVVFMGFQEAIGRAKIERRQAAIEEGQARVNGEQKRHDERKERSSADDEKMKQVRENWEKEKKELEEAKLISELANKRSGYVDRYFLMFGFLLIAFGCLGYLIGEFGLVLRIVAAVILLMMVIALFKQAVGASAEVNARFGLG